MSEKRVHKTGWKDYFLFVVSLEIKRKLKCSQNEISIKKRW